MQTMQTIWDRIEAWLSIHAPEVLDNLLTGVDDDDLHEIEAELGYPLPEDVRASLRIHNGTLDCFADIWALLNIDEMAQEQRRMSLGSSLKRPHWLPLARDGCGDFLCVDVEPEPGEQWGQIIHFDHETVSSWVAPSFHALLSTFANHLEMGKYAVDETVLMPRYDSCNFLVKPWQKGAMTHECSRALDLRAGFALTDAAPFPVLCAPECVSAWAPALRALSVHRHL